MNRLHIVPEINEANGVYQVARALAREQTSGDDVARVVTAAEFCLPKASFNLHLMDEVYVHGMWLPKEWRACWKVLRSRAAIGVPRLVRMTHGSLSPVYLERQGKWKKRLVAPIERWLFSKTDRVVVTGAWEKSWCRAWGVKNEIEIVDLKKLFCERWGERSECGGGSLARTQDAGSPLHLLYLGRRHPLKGVEFLERAVREINEESERGSGRKIELRIESALFGAEKDAAWEWCDVFCLPTLSENFGLVVAEALAHGKPVVTTDGAPAWADCEQVICLRGYRDGTDAERVALLKSALLR